jgi:cysteine desulfurase
MKRVYLDHNATSPLRPEVRSLIVELLDGSLGNPSAVHASGRRARALIDESRARVAGALGVHEDEIFFTSGATEANNLAVFGRLSRAPSELGLAVSPAEHSSLLGPARVASERGRQLHLLPLTPDGHPRVDDVLVLARDARIALVALSAANNETGAALDLEQLGVHWRELPRVRPHLHVDAVQALGRLPIQLERWQADTAAFSAHKVGGPLGVGVLWRRRRVELVPRAFGGGQELDLRPGTENAPAIAGAALALELAVRAQESEASRLSALTASMWAELSRSFQGLRLVGPPLSAENRLPNTLCVLFPKTDGKVLVTRLDLAGLEVSAGSACASGSIEPSHVLLSMGFSSEEARSAVRISLGWNTTEADCKHALRVFHEVFSSSRAT